MIILRNAPPLLITASLDPGRTPQVALTDVRERTLRHMEGLVAWIKEPWVQRVVFAKNCPLSVRAGILSGYAARHGKELEFVQVSSSARTARQGKGYGEGDLIRKTLEKSEVLRASRDFIKVTGKLFMPEAARVFTSVDDGEFFVSEMHFAGAVSALRRFLGPAYRFRPLGRSLAMMRKCRVPWEWIAATPEGWVDTRCYRAGVDFYRARLLRSHERVRDALGYTLETAAYDDLKGSPGIRRIVTTPVIIGVSGTMGTSSGGFPDDVIREASALTEQLLSPHS